MVSGPRFSRLAHQTAARTLPGRRPWPPPLNAYHPVASVSVFAEEVPRVVVEEDVLSSERRLVRLVDAVTVRLVECVATDRPRYQRRRSEPRVCGEGGGGGGGGGSSGGEGGGGGGDWAAGCSRRPSRSQCPRSRPASAAVTVIRCEPSAYAVVSSVALQVAPPSADPRLGLVDLHVRRRRSLRCPDAEPVAVWCPRRARPSVGSVIDTLGARVSHDLRGAGATPGLPFPPSAAGATATTARR